MVLHANVRIGAHPTIPDQQGLFATAPILAGEAVWEQGDETTYDWWTQEEYDAIPEDALVHFDHFSFQVGKGLYQTPPEFRRTPMEQWDRIQPVDDSVYMNHSCDPTTWFRSPTDITLTASRDVKEGEELTFDYAMSESCCGEFTCSCGTALCRSRVRGDDYKREDLRLRYKGHMLAHLTEEESSRG